MRVTQSMLYSSSIYNMNKTLSELMYLNEQGSSEKKINRPSDDPSGYDTSLELHSELSALDTTEQNINTADAWLSLADSTLLDASTLLSSIKELAEQGATDTYTAEQRQDIAVQVRELFESMVGLANTKYTDEYIFAGQKTDSSAYAEALYVTVDDDTLTNSCVESVTGSADYSILVEFTETGTVGADELEYRYTTDGGSSWTTATLSSGDTSFNLGSCEFTLASGAGVTAAASGAGTSMIVRPSAVYLGDAADGVDVTQYGTSPVEASADGNFDQNVVVRIDSDTNLAGPITYSYSLDGGENWVQGNVSSNTSLSIPGGMLDLASGAGSALYEGSQFIVQPDTAYISVDIGNGSEVVINGVGKDIFGGLYQDSDESAASPVLGDDGSNVLETIGELIGYLETNNSDGIGDCVAMLTNSVEQIATAAADVGGRETRLEYATKAMDDRQAIAESALSEVEDVDYSQLMIDLAKAELAYETVLNTTTIILGMSLLDYV